MTSCLLIRWSRRQRIRDQARSAAATTTVATSTAAIVLTQRSSTRCGSMPGSMSIAVSRTTFWPISIIIATAITAASLMRLFRNSVQPRAPNTRLRPLRSEMREASGRILSGTMRGGLWATEARTPAAVRRMTVGRRKRTPASTRGPARASTSSPRRMRQPAGSSMRPTSAEKRPSARAGMTKMRATRVADSEANSGASREKATSPRSTASWSRFSVGSSVLSSGSTSSLIAHSRAATVSAGLAPHLTPIPRSAGRQARSRCGSPCRARFRRSPCAPWRRREAARTRRN